MYFCTDMCRDMQTVWSVKRIHVKRMFCNPWAVSSVFAIGADTPCVSPGSLSKSVCMWSPSRQVSGEIHPLTFWSSPLCPPTGPYLNGDNCSACLQEHCEQPTPLACLIYRQPLKGQPWNLIWSFTDPFWIRNLNNNFPFAQPFNCEIQLGSFGAAGNVTALQRDFARILLKCLQVSFPYLTNFSF